MGRKGQARKAQRAGGPSGRGYEERVNMADILHSLFGGMMDQGSSEEEETHLSNEQLMKEHEQLVQRQKTMMRKERHLMQSKNTNARCPQTNFPLPPNPNDCTPIHVKALQPDTTHKARFLRGTIVSNEPVVMEGAAFLVKDEKGDIVKVDIYNFIPDFGVTHMQRIKAACQSLEKGKHVLMLEPCYTMSEGGPCIRIDNPYQLVFLDSLGPTDISGWQEEGKKHFQAKQYVEAVHCYDKALQLLDKDSSLTSPLLNLSATAMKLKQPKCALLYAGAATAIQPTNNKAWYRMALAFDCIPEGPGNARYCMEMSAKLIPSITSKAKSDLMAQLKNAGKRTMNNGMTADALNKRLQKALAGIALEKLGAVQAAKPAFAGLKQDSSKHAHEFSAAARAMGNEHFTQGRWTEALKSYLAALQPLHAQAGVLLSNRAAAKLVLPAETELLPCLWDAQAACVIDPTNIKAHFRRSTALLQLGWLAEARQACDAGLKLAPEDAHLLHLHARLQPEHERCLAIVKWEGPKHPGF